MEIPKGARNQFEMPEDSLADKFDFGDEENVFHDAGPANLVVREEKDDDMLELIYDEYPEEIEAINVHMVHGESLVVHTIIDTSLEEGEDWRQVENLLDISRETMPGVNSEIKKADSVSTIKTDSSERESNVEIKKKQENLKASNSVKVMQPFRVKLLALDVKAKFAKDITENLVPIISHPAAVIATLNAELTILNVHNHENSINFSGTPISYGANAISLEKSVLAGQTNILISAKTSGTALLDERSLLACIGRTIPTGCRFQISLTLPIRLGKVPPLLHWFDHKKSKFSFNFLPSISVTPITQPNQLKKALQSIDSNNVKENALFKEYVAISKNASDAQLLVTQNQHSNGIHFDESGGFFNVKILSQANDLAKSNGSYFERSSVTSVESNSYGHGRSEKSSVESKPFGHGRSNSNGVEKQQGNDTLKHQTIHRLLFSLIIAFRSCALSALSDKSSILSYAASFTIESQEIVIGSTSSGALLVFPCLQDEGVGETAKLRRLKCRAEDTEFYDVDMAKKLKSITQELFKDEETYNLELLNDESVTSLDQMKETLKFRKNVSIASKFGKSPWEAMASYTEHLLSKPSDEGQGSHFHPELDKAVCTEIRKVGDQGLSIEDVYSLVRMPGEKAPQIIILALQEFVRDQIVYYSVMVKAANNLDQEI
ncbi:hypothetical protein Goarm_019986 [Gossypium armourianum]|uniref:DUF7725 domain-containing protein n=1 Tax=Gossypium armourianum TaxID=34283 RepID=A0A7J9INQ3_9ROSI|nr:hypothetical protein [Gossypium armourianum]